MRKILEANLVIDEQSGMQHTRIVEEHVASGESVETILIEQPLTLEDRGHEMVLARS